LEYVQNRRVPVPEEDYELLWLLAKEFERSDLSAHFSERLRKRQPDWEAPPNTYLGDGNRNPFAHLEGSGPRVTITVEGRSTTYELLKSLTEIAEFAFDLKEAKEEDIVIDGIEDRDRLIEKAVEAVYSNAVANIPNCDTKRPFLVLTLWELGVSLREWCIDAAIYCFSHLHKIAPTGFDTARLLLLSQCIPGTFTPLPRAERHLITNVVLMLEQEKNGKRKEANDVLREFHVVSRYGPSFPRKD
jgi:hypothetical protein